MLLCAVMLFAGCSTVPNNDPEAAAEFKKINENKINYATKSKNIKKDRRKIGGPGDSGGGRSGTFPRYGNYAIYGNVIMLCEGPEEIALENCWDLINNLSN